MKRALLSLLGTVSAACGDGGGSSGPAPQRGPAAAMIAVPAPGDVEVARVGDRVVYGSCVADQIKRDPKLSKQAALAQCVDFELLAQRAEAKHLETDREVVESTRTALVRRLIDAFEAKYPDAASMSAQIDETFKKAGTNKRPELRVSYYALVNVDRTASADKLQAARTAAEQLYQRLANETGLFASQLRDAATGIELGAGLKFEFNDFGATPRDNRHVAPEYLGALFGISEVGRVSPVVQTEFGFHVVLLTELRPETAVERDQVFAALRRQKFIQYVTELMTTTRTEVHAELLAPPEEAAP